MRQRRINPRALGKALANKRLVSAQLLGAFNERRQAHFFPRFGRVVQQEHLQRLRALMALLHLLLRCVVERVLHQSAVVEHEQRAAAAALQRHFFLGERPLFAVFQFGDVHQFVCRQRAGRGCQQRNAE